MTAYQQWSVMPEVGTIEGSVSGKGGVTKPFSLSLWWSWRQILDKLDQLPLLRHSQMSIGLCDNFISEHCQLTQSFFGTRPRSNTTQKIFSAKWTSKGNLGKQLTESAIWYHTHISESVLQGNIVHCVPFLKFHQNYEIPKVCQYCGKVPISFHNLSSHKHTLPSNIPDICHHLFSLVSKN